MDMAFLLLLCCNLALIVQALKIAIFVPYLADSQVLFNKRVAEALDDAGHEVTVYVQHFFEQQPSKVKFRKHVNVEHVNASTGLDGDELNALRAQMTFEDIALWDPRMRAAAAHTQEFAKSCEKFITNQTFVSRLIAAHFDIAFTHAYTPCPIGLIHHAKIPTWIWLDGAMMQEHIAVAIGLHMPPSYAMPIVMDSGENMTFYERTKSFIGQQIMDFYWRKMICEPETALFKKHFGADFPDLYDLAKAVPLVMVNSNELYDYARPTLDKVVNIGGLGIEQSERKPLNEEYGRLVNASCSGHILMTFGSAIPMYLMPTAWKEAFLGAFSNFPDIQFFVRYENDDLTDRVPKNVHLSKWLPQGELLAHEKCLGLISHGGYNSLQDAVYAGVPIVTIGLFGDQLRNAHLAVKLGLGVNLRKTEISQSTVVDAINKLLKDESLSMAARRLQAQVAKKPVSPEELLVRWTSFVAEFKTLDNLVPYGTRLNVITYHSVDVIALLVAIGVFLWTLVFFLIVCTYRFCRRRHCRVGKAYEECKK